ncbi:ABC transporter substrate-binding protein [Bradyrhizobium liaoningense]|uniref:ABC transporter substrate-binding protein n=1 Tax=Bradyrhizobium liaoningense TaxID=43992 RepID=UPI001BA98A44|nr:ABC transporter substrate-binding protein [Bradyrhizobium liaoningense]MBR0737659.1 ABC transporter substrate-binding protein [Bradyrhizobium liaoningense]
MITLTVIAIAGALYGVLRSGSSPVESSRELAAPTVVLLDGSFGARFAGEMVANREGFFAANVVLRAEPNDLDFVATVVRERAIGVTSGQKFLLAAWGGIPVTAFAASFLDTSIAIFTLEASGLRRPADLIDKRLGYRRGSEGEVIFDAMMAQLRLPRSQIVKLPDRDNFDALIAGEVDAIIAAVDREPAPSEPGYVRLNVIKPQDYGIHVPGMVYFASSDLVRDRPSAIMQVLTGVIKGWHFVYSDYTRSVPALVRFDPESLKPERIKFELERQRELVLPADGRIADYDERRWRTLRDVLLFAKLGEQQFPLTQLVNYQFLRDVYRQPIDRIAPGAMTGRN